MTRTHPTRREWLAGVAVAGLAALGAAPNEAAEVEAIRRRAKEAGLADVRSSETAHYVGVGDGPDAFRRQALQLCENLAITFQKDFQSKGFEVTFPPGKMAVVVLAGRKSYEAFKGEPVKKEEGGHYDVAADRLVIFDFRGGAGGQPAAAPARLNTFTLVHEAIHQLTYATGLLARKGDVPVAVSEGFATYGELWRDAERGRVFGRVNGPRLRVMAAPDGGPDWLPLSDLLTDDDLFFNEKTEQLAYAESWLLTQELLRTKAGAKRLRAYLDALRARKDAGNRLRDARGALGDLDRLDRDLKHRARLLLAR